MNTLDQRLLNDFQRDFPLTARPYAAMAEKLGVTEDDVIDALKRLRETGSVSRVGAVFKTGTVGASTLAAMAVPADRLEDVAAMISAYPAVNHNYEREHRLNLWFVATAPDESALADVLADMERRSGLSILNLPMEEGYHLDLGFDLKWT